ncbi:hypothetical protein L6C46_14485, partial [Staphylococcus aureus]
DSPGLFSLQQVGLPASGLPVSQAFFLRGTGKHDCIQFKQGMHVGPAFLLPSTASASVVFRLRMASYDKAPRKPQGARDGARIAKK